MTPSLEGSPTKAKEAPSPHEVRMAPLDTNPVFECRGEISMCEGNFNGSYACKFKGLQNYKIPSLVGFHSLYQLLYTQVYCNRLKP